MPKAFPRKQASLHIPQLQFHCQGNELFIKTWELLLSRTGGQELGRVTVSSEEHSGNLFSGQ